MAFGWLATTGEPAIWIASLAGSPPVRLTNTNEVEHMCAWSPNGGGIAYLQRHRSGLSSVLICKTSGQATPVELRSRVSSIPFLPDWSPTGEWITFLDDAG